MNPWNFTAIAFSNIILYAADVVKIRMDVVRDYVPPHVFEDFSLVALFTCCLQNFSV